MVGMLHPERNERADKRRTFCPCIRWSASPRRKPGSALGVAPIPIE